MIKKIILPQLGQTMEEATIVTCLVEVGEEVEKGDSLFEIETDKAVLEVESSDEGYVKHILVEEGQTLPVGEVLIIIADEDEEVSREYLDSLKSDAPSEAASAISPTEEKANAEPEEAQATTPGDKVIVSPRAKKLAIKLGIDLAMVTGTGPGGRITEKDIEKAVDLQIGSSSEADLEIKLGATLPLNKAQRITGERMVKSKQEIPCFYLNINVDVSGLVELRARLNEAGGNKISYNDFIIKAVASGLAEFPLMTGQLLNGNIKLADSINIGVAVAAPEGLIVPVIKDVHQKDLRQISLDNKDVIEKARTNKLSLVELEGACTTISTLGAFGIDSFIPVVIPGQTSIFGIGKIAESCVPVNGEIMIRKLMSMTLAVDHRIVDGAYASQFLEFVKNQLEDSSNFA